MTFERPHAWALLALAVPIIILFLRFRRRRDVDVPSLAIWHNVAPAGVGRRGLRRIEDPDPFQVSLAHEVVEPRMHQPDHSDLHSAPLEDRVGDVPDGEAPPVVPEIRAERGKAGDCDEIPEILLRNVEIVVAGRPGVVPDQVHHFEEGAPFRTGVRPVGDRVAGHDVAGVEEKRGGSGRADGVGQLADPDKAADHRARRFLHPERLLREKLGVHVVCMEENERFPVAAGSSLRKEEGGEDENSEG